MSLETAIFVATFAIIGARLLSSRRNNGSAPAREHGSAAEPDGLIRPVLLFSTTPAPVARC